MASPGDVLEERRAVRDVLKKLERSPLVRGDFTIEVVSWDDPDGPVPMLATLTPQQAVTLALPKPSECDLTIVIVSGRLGTPLDEYRADGTRYGSGTEWEFEDAKNVGRPVLLYRCIEQSVRPSDDAAAAATERRRVDQFFAQFTSPTGALTGGVTTYRTSAEFAARLRTDIETILRTLLQVRREPGGDDMARSGSWTRRMQSRVRRWHYGRLMMVVGGGLVISVIGWTTFTTFAAVVEDHDAPVVAYAARYVVLGIVVAIPLLLLVLTWWWLVPDRSRQAD